MSLVRIALRLAAVEAVRGRTIFGDRVIDSPNGAFDIQADGRYRTAQDKPFIAVYTQSGMVKHERGRNLHRNGSCEIVFESGLSSAMTETDPETGASTLAGIMVPATDRNIEFQLDIVGRQIRDALIDPANAWGQIFLGLTLGFHGTDYSVASSRSSGQSLAGHQMRISLDLIDDPVRGEPLPNDASFARFLAKLGASADETLRAHAQTMGDVLGLGLDPDWMQFQRRAGHTADALHALGRGPIAGDDDRATPVFAAAEINAAGSGTIEVP